MNTKSCLVYASTLSTTGCDLWITANQTPTAPDDVNIHTFEKSEILIRVLILRVACSLCNPGSLWYRYASYLHLKHVLNREGIQLWLYICMLHNRYWQMLMQSNWYPWLI